MINMSPINEKNWEEVNSMIFTSSGIDIFSKSNGSHLSGMDIDCSIGKISNKSAKYSPQKKGFKISSYRLTGVCGEKNYGTPAEIINEINRRKNYDYYSFIIRDETTNPNKITYDWLFIPSSHHLFEPESYIWEPKIGKQAKHIDSQIGWKTNKIFGSSMSVIFSMSSQLWVDIEMSDEIRSYIIASAEVDKKPEYNYISIIDKITGCAEPPQVLHPL
jgi:hypothetical protein